MKIKHDYSLAIAVPIILSLAVLLYFLVDAEMASVVAIIFALVSFRYAQVFGKKICIDEKGCYVQFLWYRKQYAWEELTVKRVERYSLLSGGHRINHKSGCVFSAHPIHKPKWMNPVAYCFCCRPMSVFFVLFEYEREKDFFQTFPYIYEVSETEFREKIQQWNIQLQENY